MSFQSIAWQLMSEDDYAAYIEEKITMTTATKLTILCELPEDADHIIEMLTEAEEELELSGFSVQREEVEV